MENDSIGDLIALLQRFATATERNTIVQERLLEYFNTVQGPFFIAAHEREKILLALDTETLKIKKDPRFVETQDLALTRDLLKVKDELSWIRPKESKAV